MKKISKLYLVIFLFIIGIVGFTPNNNGIVLVAKTSASSKLINNLTIENIENDDSIKVTVKFVEDEVYNKNIADVRKSFLNKNELIELRKNNKKHHKARNKNINNELLLTKKGYIISSYSPFATKYYEHYSEYINDEINILSLAKQKIIEKIYIDSCSNEEESLLANVGLDGSNVSISLESAKELIGVDDDYYFDNKIKIGIIDDGYIDNETNFSSIDLVNLSVNSGNSKHSTAVASIIGGDHGIVHNATLYFHKYTAPDLFTPVETMIDENITLINMSFHVEVGNSGAYDGYSAYIDYVAWCNGICFIAAAGNNSESLAVNNPANGFNVIAVGATDATKTISWFSSWKAPNVPPTDNPNYATNPYYRKPTLVAPGENVIIPNVTDLTAPDGFSGTSFSAPMVTGVVALLIQEFPFLEFKPHLISSVLIAGAETLPGQTETWDPQGGAGFLNYKNCRKVLLDTQNYSYAEFFSTHEENYVLISKEFTSTYQGNCKISLVNNINSGITTPSDELIDIYNSAFYFKIYKNDELICNTIPNQNIYLYDLQIEQNCDYKIEVLSTGFKINPYVEYVSLSIFKQHTNHMYTYSYQWINTSQHIAYCVCGEAIHASHFVKNNSSKCVWCGGTANSLIGGLST